MNKNFLKIFIVSIFLISFLSVLLFDLDQLLSFENIKKNQNSLQNLINENYYFYYMVFFIIYIVVTTFALPFAAIKTIIAGALFGLIPGVLLTSFASSIGSTLCFLMSRFVLRNYIENKYQKYLKKVNLGISKDGVFYLFFLRLSPIFPFFIVNLIFGLTEMKATTFYIISQIGMLIGTVVFVNAGVQLAKINSIDDIISFEIIISFMLIGLVPFILKKIIERFKK
ncbi:MAG: TVP38/TMEM64 family protein [Candidatus Pelagibacter sp.]|nr:TVP38/TMEM64 family protein [Candidatus Pelagibacter sp.]OUV87577.1 MAG: TVP38/TMEM64 family protein [Pelagibacteraceae bacterium TMED136]|tara:strand:+ start:1327 stop:2004 length:678 start_codon:yes stop_codon:yes gene_type:complete